MAAAEGLAVLAFAMAVATPAGAQSATTPYQFMRREYQRQQQQHGNGFFGGFFGGWDHQPSRRYRATPQVRRHVDYSRAPPPPKQESQPDPNKPITTIVVMGGSMADWLAYGLEDAFSDSPNVQIVRKDEPNSGLLRYKRKSDLDWWHVARDDLANQKANFVVMMLGVMDRQNIRESDAAKEAEQEAQKKAAGEPVAAANASKTDQAKEAKGAKEAKNTPKPSHGNGVLTFRSPQWERVYTRRIDKTIAALKSRGVPVFWVGLPSIRGTKSTADAVYLNNLYRQRAARAGIVYVDVWDGFVDDSGKYSSYGPDYEGQTRRLRSPDGVFFTKYGARKLAHYVEREIRRYMTNRVTTLSFPSGPLGPVPGTGKSAVRPLAGPVLPLTAPNDNSDVLLGGAGAPPPRHDPTASSVLVKGNALSAPPGRADDFKWPPDSKDYGKPPPATEKTSKANKTSPAAGTAAAPRTQAGARSTTVPLTPGSAGAGQGAGQAAETNKATAGAALAKAEANAKVKAEAEKQAQKKAAQKKAAQEKATQAKAAAEKAKETARQEAEARQRAADRARAEAQQGLRPPGRIEPRRQAERRPRRQSDNPLQDLFGIFGH